jgi:hypothetical protein
VSGRTIKALAAVMLAAVLAVVLAGCGGGPVRAGAAAIVGGDRITVATLGQAVEDWRREFRADQRANLIRSRSRPLPEPEMTNALIQLLLVRVYDEAGRRAGVRPSDGQVDLAVRFLNERFGSAGSYARARGLPARYARDLARTAFLQGEIERRHGAGPGTTLLREAMRSLKIKVNPRYGTFDEKRVLFGPTKYTLSRPEPGTS